MRIGVIIPDRGDRPKLLNNCIRMMKNQTVKTADILLINYTAESEKCDITQRYKAGYDLLRNKDLDMIAFIENDDWYAPDYLETMAWAFEANNRPTLLGLDHTVYYHIGAFSHFTMHHSQRSSAMNTCIKPDLDIDFGPDENPYTDAWLWNKYASDSKIFVPKKEICMGIKHGVGMCGGQNHTTHMHRYVNQDHDKNFLRQTLDPKSFEFYANYFNPNYITADVGFNLPKE